MALGEPSRVIRPRPRVIEGEAVLLEDLSTEPPAGPTVMSQAHADGMRKAVALLKNRLVEPERAEESVTAAVLVYLTEWAETYARGSQEAVDMTTRTIIQIRSDTMHQISLELRSPRT